MSYTERIVKLENGTFYKYKISSIRGTFNPDYVKMEKNIPIIEDLIRQKKGMTVWLNTKINLLQQLQAYGKISMEMDIVNLVRNGTLKNLDLITDNCLEFMEKAGYKAEQSPKSGAYEWTPEQ